MDENFTVGVKRERPESGKKRSKQCRSDEARERRKKAAKERYKNNKLRKRLERANLKLPVKGAGASKKYQPESGTSCTSQGPLASSGDGEVNRNLKGTGNQPSQTKPIKERDEGPRSKETRNSKETCDSFSRNSPPKQKPSSTGVKPPRGGKHCARPGHPARPSGQPRHLFLRIEGAETTTEDMRCSLMEYLATSIAKRATSSTTRPVFITDSRLETNGSIRLTVPDQETADTIRELLGARGDVRFLEGPGVLRRFVFGGPSYLNKMTPEQIQRLFERQNPGLPQGSIRVVSVDTSGLCPLFFVEITKEGHAFLKERDFLLDSMTSKVFLRSAGWEKRKDKSPDH